MKYTKRLKVLWFAFLAGAAVIFFVMDLFNRTIGLQTMLYCIIFCFVISQMFSILKHYDEE